MSTLIKLYISLVYLIFPGDLIYLTLHPNIHYSAPKTLLWVVPGKTRPRLASRPTLVQHTPIS